MPHRCWALMLLEQRFFPRMIRVILSPECFSWSRTQEFSPPSDSRWRSQRAAWKTLCFHPVWGLRTEHRSSLDKAVGVRSASSWLYLLAGFYEFINRHHSVSVPIHLLKNDRNDTTQWCKESGRGFWVAADLIPGRISPHVQRENHPE